MNATCEFIQISAIAASGQRAIELFADTWLESQEFRIAVFTMTALACIMCWVTSMVREIVRAATTVLCTLRACDISSLNEPCSRTAGSSAPASGASTRHKMGGGPPPGSPPPVRH